MAARARAKARVRDGAQVWRDRVERWKQSGKTAREFARLEGIRPETLAWWKWRLQRQDAATQARADVTGPRLVPVQVADAEPEPAACAIELVLACGRVVVRVGPEFDERTLRRVVDALGGAS